MQYILRFIRPFVQLNLRYPWLVVLLALTLTGISASLALRLKVDTDIVNLLPESFDSVKALNKLQESVGGETDMQVAIVSPSFEANLAFADTLIPALLSLTYERTGGPYFERVEFRKETDILRDNALFLATHQELNAIQRYLETTAEETKMEVNPFFFDLEDDFEDEEENGTADNADLRGFEESYEAIIPEEYPVSADSTIMVIKFFPTGSKSDIQFLRDMFTATDQVIAGLNPESFEPQMQVASGGRLMKHLMELDSIMQDVFSSFASGISSVLVVVMIYFSGKMYINYRRGAIDEQKKGLIGFILRTPIPVLVIGIPLVSSLSYTFAMAYLALGTLNTMTSVLFVILFGLGIDYGIHFFARYLEVRSDGKSVEEALLITYDNTGAAILTSSFTTAVAFFVLIIADFRGFSEFGLISGTGILLAFLCTQIIMPALIVLFERYGLILVNRNLPQHAERHPHLKYPFPRAIVTAGILISVFILFQVPKLEFEYNFGTLEPEFVEHEKFSATVSQVFKSQRRNPAYVIADTDEEVEEILETIRLKVNADSSNRTIDDVEALQERFPVRAADVNQKLDKIAEIRELLEDPVFAASDDEILDKLKRAAGTQTPLQIRDIPDFLTARFVSKDGNIGRFVIIYPDPALDMSDGRNSIAFKKDVGGIETPSGKVFHAGSTSLVAADMLDLMLRESPYMVTGAFFLILILMLWAFKSVRWTLIGLMPLLIGLLFTFGIMLLFGVKLNFYNIVVLPVILGIGEDSGVHLALRYVEEGKNSTWAVMSSTGQHITVGSLTTILGFVGLLFTTHPGLYSIGFMATVGISMTWLTSMTLMPALIQILEDRNLIQFERPH